MNAITFSRLTPLRESQRTRLANWKPSSTSSIVLTCSIMSETNAKDAGPTEQELQEEEAVRKAAQKLVDEAMEQERKRRVDESKVEVTDKMKLDSLNRLVNVQEQMLRQINLMKVRQLARAGCNPS